MSQSQPRICNSPLLRLYALAHRGLDLCGGDWQIHRSNTHQCVALLTVNVGEAGSRFRTVEIQYERYVRAWEGEVYALPVLAFVLAQGQQGKRPAGLDAKQTLASSVNTPAAEVAANPAAIEFFGHPKHGAGATEKIGYEVAGRGGGFQDPLQQSLGFLRGKTAIFRAIRRLQHGDAPYIVYRSLIGLAIHDLPIQTLGVDNGRLLFIPHADELLHFAFSPLFNLLIELVGGTLAVPEDNVVIGRKALHVALKFVVVVPHDFVEKVAGPKNTSSPMARSR